MFKLKYPQLKTTEGELFPVHRIYCVAKNYADHVLEMGSNPDRCPPFFFSKPADAVTQSNEVDFPPMTENLHHEVELVLALGTGGSIYGYAVGVDLTRRDLQTEAKRQARPWDMAKGFDQSAPISTITPVLHSLDSLDIRLQVNSETRQNGNTAQMIWSVTEILASLGKYVELKAGDLVFTGTPAGVSALQRGDNIEISLGDNLHHSFSLV